MQLRDRLHQVRMQARSLRRSIDELEQTSRETLARFGLEPRFGGANTGSGTGTGDGAHDVVDVGPTAGSTGLGARLPVLVKKGLQGLMLGASFAVLGFALLALGMFTGAAALAYVLITRGLGLRIDVNRPATA